MKFSDIKIRNARLSDVDELADIIAHYSRENLLLPRSMDQIVGDIRNFFVAVSDSKIIGCCAISFFSKYLAEIRSVAVLEEFQRFGVGRKLIEYTEQVLKDEQVENVFVLTRAKDFFIALSYSEVPKSQFPQKIWKDCMTCPNLMKCDEIAMIKNLD